MQGTTRFKKADDTSGLPSCIEGAMEPEKKALRATTERDNVGTLRDTNRTVGRCQPIPADTRNNTCAGCTSDASKHQSCRGSVRRTAKYRTDSEPLNGTS